nr:hypothetical protein [Tanacetum cinerariifolium]
MFDLDYLTNSMNYEPVLVENQANKSTGPKEANNSAGYKIENTIDSKTCEKPVSQVEQIFLEELENLKRQEKEANDADRKETTHENQNAHTNSTNILNTVSTPLSVAVPSREFNDSVQTRSKVNKNFEAHALSAFLYGIIDKEVYVTQPPGFVDPKFPNKVYKVVKALYGLHQPLRAWYATLSTFLEQSGYRRGAINKTLFIKQDKKDIMLVQVYIDDIIFGSTKKSWCDEFEELMKNSMKTASTPIETQKPLVKDEEAVDVDVHLYRSMIGSLMYLNASRPNIMFAVCACFRFQYPKVSSFDLEAYSDNDYAGVNLDRKSTIGGCQFLGRRLILWQCKMQTIMATSTTEAEYVAAAHYCGQVL